MRRNKQDLFDDFIGTAGQDQRDSDAELLGGLKIDEELDFGGALDRQVGGAVAFENPTGIDAELMICIRIAGPVAHQTAGCGEFAKQVDRG